MNHTKNSKEMTQNEMPILFSEEAGAQGLASSENNIGISFCFISLLLVLYGS